MVETEENKRLKELLEKIGGDKLEKVFIEVARIGLEYGIEPKDIIAILNVKKSGNNIFI